MTVSISAVKKWFRHGDTSSAPRLRRAATAPAVPLWQAEIERLGIPSSLVYPSTTLGEALEQTADRYGDATSLIYNHRTWTFHQLQMDINRLAGGFAGLGVSRGDRVLMTLPNCPEFVTTLFAVEKLGAMIVNAGPLMGIDELAALIALTSPKVVVGLDLHAAALARASAGSAVQHAVWVTLQSYQNMLNRMGYQWKLWQEGNRSGDRIHQVSLAQLLAEAPSQPPTVRPDPQAAAILQPTGGTTGTVKVAELTHRNLLANATQVGVWMGVRPGQECFLAALPMFHVYGLTSCLMTSILYASRLVLVTRFNTANVLEQIREHQPTVFPLVPAICDAISDRLEQESVVRPLSGLKLCISGAAPLPQKVAERFTRLTGAPVLEGYGLTEASPVTHVNLPGKGRIGSIGLPLPDVRCRVVELDGSNRDVRPGEPGELLINGPQVMSGYWANPEQSKIALQTDAAGTVWLHTGDIVRVDEQGYFYVVDRRKDMIIRSGLKIYPARVEAILKNHHQVTDAAVVGRPDPVHTESVVAFIVSNEPPDAHAKIETELRVLCREHLASYQVPSEFRFVKALPRSALGKLLKRDLRQEFTTSMSGDGNGQKVKE